LRQTERLVQPASSALQQPIRRSFYASFACTDVLACVLGIALRLPSHQTPATRATAVSAPPASHHQFGIGARTASAVSSAAAFGFSFTVRLASSSFFFLRSVCSRLFSVSS